MITAVEKLNSQKFKAEEEAKQKAELLSKQMARIIIEMPSLARGGGIVCNSCKSRRAEVKHFARYQFYCDSCNKVRRVDEGYDEKSDVNE